MIALFVTESPEFKTLVDSCYCFQCEAKNEALLDSYTYRYGSGGNNLKGLVWNNFNKKTGKRLTTKCSHCSDIIYRVKIIEEDSPTIKSAKLKNEPIQDIGYYARKRQIEETSMFGADNVVQVGSGPKAVPKPDVPITNFYTVSLKSITYYYPLPSPNVRVYCPVCSATGSWQPSLRPSEANLFCRHCQLQFKGDCK